MSDQATLSLAMIVRDAERTLGAALGGVRPFVDELVVVDTGSQDGTREVARQFGAKVFDFAWCDDFSAARNESLRHATGDWIFWLDADDVLPPQSGRELRAQIDATPGRDAAFFVMVEEEIRDQAGRLRRMGHAHVKLFPRHEQICFRYRIHEQVAPAIRTLGMPIRQSAAIVRHAHADRSPAAELARSQRNLRLALLDLAERPDDPFVWLSVGTAYLHSESGAAQAVEHLTRCAAAFPRGSSVQLNAYLYLARAHAAAGDQSQERATYEAALRIFPDDAALLMRLAAWHERYREIEAAIACYESALTRGRMRATAVQLRGEKTQIALKLGQLYIATGRSERAQRLWQQVVSVNPSAADVRQALEMLQLQSPSIIA